MTKAVLQLAGFNPTLIQLREDNADAPNASLVRFNPTLIQLRDRFVCVHMWGDLGFNPTLIQLREWRSQNQWPFVICFNPTLIQLRAKGATDAQNLRYKVSIPP